MIVQSFWMLWPDASARGGGHCNQLEQLLGRLQCATWAENPSRTMVLPDLREDRPVSRRHDFAHLYDVATLRTVCDVVSWTEFLESCPEVSVIGDERIAAHSGYSMLSWTSHRKGGPPRCSVGVNYTPFVAFSCPPRRDRRELFKSGRLCRGGVTSPTCQLGFDWSSSLNASGAFRGIVDESRRAAHFDTCNVRALSRLDADSAAPVLDAFEPSPRIANAIDEARKTFGLVDGEYDAVHLRLGDFVTLCRKTDDPRAAKFCPPSPDRFGLAAALLGSRPLLLLSDEPDKALRHLRRPLINLANFSAHLFPDAAAPRLVLEIELAISARAFLGVACSTVSQWIIKRREARYRASRPFFLWP